MTNTTASANHPRVVVEPGQDLKDLLIGGKTQRPPTNFNKARKDVAVQNYFSKIDTVNYKAL